MTATDDWVDVPSVPAGGADDWTPVGGGAPDRPMWDTADVAKSAASGTVEGIARAPYFLNDLVNMAGRGENYAFQKAYPLFTGHDLPDDVKKRLDDKMAHLVYGSSDILKPAEDLTGIHPYQSQSTAGDYANTIMQTIAGGKTAGVEAGIPRLATIGAASEGAGQAAKGTDYEDAARLGAGILAGGLTSDPVASRVGKAVDAAETASGKLPGILGDTTSGGPAPDIGNLLVKAKGKGITNSDLAGGLHQALTDAFNKNSAKARANYAARDAVAESVPYKADSIVDPLGKVIEEIGGDKTNPGYGSLPQLQAIYKKLTPSSKTLLVDADGNPLRPSGLVNGNGNFITAKDLYDIQKFANEYFDPKSFKGGLDTAQSQLFKMTRRAISDIEDMHPDLGQMTAESNKYWKDHVDTPFRNNKVLNEVGWTPEDANAFDSQKRFSKLDMSGESKVPHPPAEGGNKLPYQTEQRQYNFMKNVNNPVRFRAVFDSLPTDLKAQFAQNIKNAIQEESGAGNRIKNLAKGVAHLGTSFLTAGAKGKPITGLIEISKALEPKYSPEQLDIMKAIKDEGYARGGAVNHNPTPGQKLAGNYKKHHMRIHGLDISIENPKGSTRTGEGKDGKKWSSTMPDHYGYIKRTQGADGDHVDVYVGSNDRSNRVYVIDQKDPDTGSFDEHKVMIGYGDRDAATAAYRAAFSDKKNRIMKVTRLSVAEFKNWLKNGNTKQPVKKAV